MTGALIHLVLVEPEIPPNTGNAIRLCANTGAELHLIKPLGFRMDDRSLRRSGLDYHDLARVSVHENFDDCARSLPDSRWFAVETDGARCYGEMRPVRGDAFVFGPETRGIPLPIRERIGRGNSLFIPMAPHSRSVNLSNAVAVIAFEAWRQLGFAGRGEPAGERHP